MLKCPNDRYLSKHSVLNFLVAIILTHQVNYGGFSAKYEEMIAYRYYSENGRYIYISTSTKKPEVKLVWAVFSIHEIIFIRNLIKTQNYM